MDNILEVKDLKKYFKTPKGMLHAVDGVSFSIEKGKTLGVVGESGCGKSTLGLLLLHLERITDGQIIFNHKDITNVTKKELKALRKDMQMIFQDPFSSLNPRKSVADTIAEPFKIYKIYKDNQEIEKQVEYLMSMVGLAKRLKNSYPHELDGGRRQRIGIARALALEPKFIVCDEPVSALDVSIQAQILNLMQDLQKELGLTYIFITHDLSVVRHISDDICVMYLGQIVERGHAKDLFKNPAHPYTQALLSAIPRPVYPNKIDRVILRGELTSPIEPGVGCRFAPRCNYATEQCFKMDPASTKIDDAHFASCHLLAQK